MAGGELPHQPNGPTESYAKAEVIHDSVRDGLGDRVRIIVTRPRHGSGNYPAVFVAGWLSCDSIEAPTSTDHASGRVFHLLAELAGFVTVRMDKLGVGDSEGVCGETDFDIELSAYRAVFRSLSCYAFIDKNRIFVFGVGNGGGLVKAWFEHMME